MLSPIARFAIAVTAALAFAAVAAGCGSSDDDTSTTDSQTTSTEAAAAGKATEIQMGDFFFKPEDVTADAGALTIDAPNVGEAPHELVLAKTDDDPGDLPTNPDGTVNEDELDVVGEIESVEAGGDGTGSFDLEPGSYVMFCNIPDHYEKGMSGTLTAK